MTRDKILIVEDEAIIARDIERQLATLGYETVGVAMSGEEAVTLAGQLRPRLVLMDIHLTGPMDGIDAAIAIRAEFGIPSVFLTAYATGDMVDRAKTALPLGYIIKPFHEPNLRTTLEIALHRSRIDDELRRSESRYRAVVQSAQDAIVTIDTAGHIIGWSPSATTIFGFTEDEVVGQPVTSLMPERYRDKHSAAMGRAGTDGASPTAGRTRQEHGLRKDGSEFPMELSLARWETNEGWFITAMIRDVTGRTRLQEQFLQAQKMEVVGRLAGGVAHDFNNLLTIINGTTELTLLDLAADDPLRPAFEDIQEAGKRAARLTRQLLTFSRKQIPSPAVVSVSEQVALEAKMLQRVIGEDIELRIHAPAKAAADYVVIDPGHLEQILMNLAVNARDAMPNGGRLTIETRLADLDDVFAAEHPGTSPGPHVVLSVKDTGHGMTPEVRSRIFDPFFTTKGAGKGTGLGLATVYGLIHQSRGCIVVDSEPGRGASFSVFLPRVASTPHSDPTPAPAIVRGRETILLAEDEPAARELTSRVLTMAGYTVVAVENGIDAMAMLSQPGFHVELLLTDVIMPGMSGPDLAVEVARTHPRLPVIFTSGYADDRLTAAAVADVNRFIAKPYTVFDLTSKVRRVLDQSAKERQSGRAPAGDTNRPTSV